MSGKIEIISASAGSGKTTRLAGLLQQAVEDGSARPEAVLATTFTNKAAAELQQRVRTTLLAAGRTSEAQRLAGARIGTVNAVCGQLVREFAFELGLSPEIKVLDEVSSRLALKRALTRAVREDELRELDGLRERMKEFDWQETISRIVDLARANRIDAAGLKESAERSIEGLLALFSKPEPADRDAPRGAALDRALRDALEGFVAAAKRSGDETKKTQGVRERAEDALRSLRARGWLPWSDWLWAAGADVGAKSRELIAPLWEAAAAHDSHPGLQADLSRAIRLCFTLAERALSAYAQYKSEWGAIDFVDQEVLALQLLETKAVQEWLTGELDLVLIDEFQDTSPIQLAIFLALARLAKRSVWVGDQKQSIFAFRGTDPALMDAALEQLLAGAEPETLTHSRRSRPALVELASEVFVRAFAAHGLPEQRVRLTHPDGKEPAGLGPVLEYHRLAAKNAGQDLAAIADGVAQLLADPTTRVRDRSSGEARSARAGDVAVLCKTNDACLGLANALEARGIRAVVPRAGLLATLEGQLVLAGLELFCDARDSLAQAVLARMLEFPTDGDALLAALLQPREAPLASHDFVRRLAQAREAQKDAGPLAAFDAVCEALELFARCAAWGDTAQRRANLDALRAHAVAYVQAALGEGAGCTAAGLVACLRELATAEEDAQATVSGEGAVVVTTWHRAKGLEWPIVVLHGNSGEGSALGVQVTSSRPRIDIDAPLAGRWIRFWPTPYLRAQTKAPFHQRLAESEAEHQARSQGLRQELRLLYVGWTRARDRLVLAGRGSSPGKGMNALLVEGEAPLLGEFGEADAAGMAGLEIAGQSVPVRLREAEPKPGEPRTKVPGTYFPIAPAREWPPAFRNPSAQEGAAMVVGVSTLGERLAISSAPEMERLGEAVHTFLAGALGGSADPTQLADEVLARWGVRGCLQPAELVEAAERLKRWGAQFEGARWHREWPLWRRQPDGSVLRGTADLVLETENVWLVIDHKSFPGTREDAQARAARFGGQLAAYAEALRAHADKPVRGFIHLPITGQLVELALEPGVEAAVTR